MATLIPFGTLDKQQRKISYHGHLLAERHNGPLTDTLPLQAFADADYLLFLRGELATEQAEASGCAWVPWSGVYLCETPHFIHNATRTAIASRLATTLGTPNITTLKARLKERREKIAKIWSQGSGYHRQSITDEQIELICTR